MKTMVITLVTILSLFLIAPAGYSYVGDALEEGKVLLEKSQLLIKKGEMMKAFKDQDKVWMVDQGHLMVKEGVNIMESGQMMNTDEGIASMQEVAQTMMAGGNLLLKMGRKKDALTEKDKGKIVNEGKTMMGMGKLMLEKGKMMAP